MGESSLPSGYNSIYCHFCGVSFNIARRRKPGEPDLASWDYTGEQCNEPGVDELDDLEECAKNGCSIAVRYPKHDEDMVPDPDYEPQNEAGDDIEPYEYDSNYESSHGGSINGEVTDDEEKSVNDADDYRDFMSSLLDPQSRFRGEPVGTFGYSNTPDRNETILPITSDTLPDEYDPEELEHIPGLTCPEANAYSGHAISLEEMRGCRTAQFLVHKDAGKGRWKPDGLHEPWEIAEDWFLSGVCDGITSRDCGPPTVRPARGGVSQPWTDNIIFNREEVNCNDLAMPFHPWCFDLFCRQSKSRFKLINVSGLIKWRNAESSYEDFHSFPRVGEVHSAQEQFWCHEPGSEYLTANPLYVPGLPTLLQSAAEDEDNRTLAVDHLTSLPLDIRLLIVDYLGSNDITTLRISSRAFTHLPDSVWYRLVREEMPWLWEVLDESETPHIPSPWTTMTANEVRFQEETREQYSRQLRDEYNPPDKIIDYLLPLPSAPLDPMKLPRANKNWHRVYTQIKRNWGMLKGLRNRRRIWEDIEEIIRRIEGISH
ncbi:hypothetical protein BDW59DRAFT_169731 [Aspergillus cavernicola]|uniref:F-box domain-containing protein n=1 Tax=Aspergillus cavernicola TaxID=176166 RepID=A0ABR4IUP9_9EURO